MPSLLDVVKCSGIEIDFESKTHTNNNEFRRFLVETWIELNPKLQVPQGLKERLQQDTPELYDSLVNTIVRFLRRSKSDNVLTAGDWFGTDTSDAYQNFKLHALKGPLWKRLHASIGEDRFVELIMCSSGFMKAEGNDTLYQIFGYEKRPVFKRPKTITNKRMLYRKKRSFAFDDKIIGSCDSTISAIVGMEKRSLPRRYRQLKGLIQSAKSRELHTSYWHIFKEIVKTAVQPGLVLESCTKPEEVVRYVHVIVKKVFPPETFGENDNWRIIMQLVASFVLTSTEICVRDVVQQVRINSIHWLGKTAKATSVQDRTNRINLLQCFLEWFFGTFVVRVVTSSFYVCGPTVFTNNSNTNKHFTHEIWRKFANDWTKEYFDNYLVKSNTSTNSGYFRLVPKKNDFRSLCVPMKPTEKVSLAQNVEMRSLIAIIRWKRRERDLQTSLLHPRCSSSRDVMRELMSFKLKVPKNCKLYGVKFDLKHCFDNLDQSKIITSVSRLFENDRSEDVFTRRFIHKSARQTQFARYRNVMSEGTNIEKFKMLTDVHVRREGAIVDFCQTVKFTRTKIIDLINDQVMQLTMSVYGQDGVYARKRGLFQGMPILGTLCEVTLDAFVDEAFPFLFNESGPCLLLRMADDFLFISNSMNTCRKVHAVASSSLAHSYGAFVNAEKCEWINFDGNALFNFVGLNVSLDDLSVTNRATQETRMPQRAKTSINAVMTLLKSAFNRELELDCAGDFFSVMNRLFDTVNDTVLTTLRNPTDFQKIAHLLMGFELEWKSRQRAKRE